MLTRLSLARRTSRPTVLQLRQVSVEASELRPGDFIEMKGRVLEIVTREHKRTGARGNALIQVCFLSRILLS